MDDRIALEHRMSTIEAQYKQLFDLLERHNDLNEKLEARIDMLIGRISKLGWSLAITLVGVITSIILSLL